MYRKIDTVTLYFEELSKDLQYVVETGIKLADRTDMAARHLKVYGEAETSGVRECLGAVSHCIEAVQDAHRVSLDQVEKRTIALLKSYYEICKAVKEEIHEREKLKREQLNRQKMLESLQIREPTNSGRIKHAKNDLSAMKEAVKVAEKSLLESMMKFERKKLMDLKAALSDFLTSQMTFYAHGLEAYTAAFRSLDKISPEKDLAELLLLRNASNPQADTAPDTVERTLVGARPPVDAAHLEDSEDF